MKPNRKRTRDLAFYALLILLLVAVIVTMNNDGQDTVLDNYSELVDLFKEEKVESFATEGNMVYLKVRTGEEGVTEELSYELYSFGVFYEDLGELIAQQHEAGIITEYEYDEGFVAPW